MDKIVEYVTIKFSVVNFSFSMVFPMLHSPQKGRLPFEEYKNN